MNYPYHLFPSYLPLTNLQKEGEKTAYNFHGKVDLSSSQIVPLISRPRNIPWFLDGSLQAFEAEKFTLEAEKFQKKLPSVKPTLTGVYRISLNSGDLLNMDVSNTRSLGMVINCSLPTVSSYFKSCFSSFPPLSSRHSGDFSRFFVFFLVVSTSSSMADVPIPRCPVASHNPLPGSCFPHRASGPSIRWLPTMLSLQISLLRSNENWKKTCSNMFFAKRSNFLFSNCFKKNNPSHFL